METFAAIEQRRSVKKFDSTHTMSDEEISQLMNAVLLSPTSFNIQNWRFVLVTDTERKAAVRDAGYHQAQFAECSMVVIMCADLNAHAKSPERYWRDADEEVSGAIVPMITGFYGDNPGLQHDEALRSCGIAAQTLMLAAKDMGYDTCPMVGFEFAKVGELINLPADHEIIMAVVVGKAITQANPRSGQLPFDEVVVRERFAE